MTTHDHPDARHNRWANDPGCVFRTTFRPGTAPLPWGYVQWYKHTGWSSRHAGYKVFATYETLRDHLTVTLQAEPGEYRRVEDLDTWFFPSFKWILVEPPDGYGQHALYKLVELQRELLRSRKLLGEHGEQVFPHNDAMAVYLDELMERA